MAVTVTGGPLAGGKTERVALEAGAGDATAVTIPSWVRKCTVQFVDSGGSAAAGTYLRGQTQVDGAAMSAHASPISAGSAYEITVALGSTRQLDGSTLYFSGAAAGYAHLDLEL